MFDLYFSLLGPYPWDVGNDWFIFPTLCACIMQVIYIYIYACIKKVKHFV